eukprot:3250045-Prymnesium_polylepis.2
MMQPAGDETAGSFSITRPPPPDPNPMSMANRPGPSLPLSANHSGASVRKKRRWWGVDCNRNVSIVARVKPAPLVRVPHASITPIKARPAFTHRQTSPQQFHSLCVSFDQHIVLHTVVHWQRRQAGRSQRWT